MCNYVRLALALLPSLTFLLLSLKQNKFKTNYNNLFYFLPLKMQMNVLCCMHTVNANLEGGNLS